MENPKQADGLHKVPFSAVPMEVIAEVGLAMAEGARKYGRHNFRVEGTEILASTYFDALLRHITAWWEGQDVDPDSGLPHIVKAIATLVVLRDSVVTGTFVDDRPPKVDPGWQEQLNEKFVALTERYPTPQPTAKQDSGRCAVTQSAAPSVPPPPCWAGPWPRF